MAHYQRYKKYRPKLYHRRMPIFWWVHKWVHTRFILRELTSVFVAFYAIVLLFHLRAVGTGAEAYANFLAWLQTPTALVLHAVALLMVLFHSVTWFNLAPKAMVIRVGKTRVPGWAIAGMNYLAWGLLSAGIAWIFLTA